MLSSGVVKKAWEHQARGGLEAHKIQLQLNSTLELSINGILQFLVSLMRILRSWKRIWRLSKIAILGAWSLNFGLRKKLEPNEVGKMILLDKNLESFG